MATLAAFWEGSEEPTAWGDCGTRNVPGERGVIESEVSMEGTGGCVEDFGLGGSVRERGGGRRLSRPESCWPDIAKHYYSWEVSPDFGGIQD